MTDLKRSPGNEFERKSARRWYIGAAVLYLIFTLCFVAFPTEMHEYYLRASTGWRVFGFFLIAASFATLYLASKLETNIPTAIASFVLFALGLCALAGFDV